MCEHEWMHKFVYNMVNLHPIFIQVAWAFIVSLKPPNHSQQLCDHIQIYTTVGLYQLIMNPCNYTHISWQQKIMCCCVNDIQWQHSHTRLPVYNFTIPQTAGIGSNYNLGGPQRLYTELTFL